LPRRILSTQPGLILKQQPIPSWTRFSHF
jgi:hypothetical protein